MYPYHNKIKQRIRSGELVGYHFVSDYPRIGKALVLEFDRPPLRRPVRPYRWAEYAEILEDWERKEKNHHGKRKSNLPGQPGTAERCFPG